MFYHKRISTQPLSVEQRDSQNIVERFEVPDGSRAKAAARHSVDSGTSVRVCHLHPY